jgi:hypothetical protein
MAYGDQFKDTPENREQMKVAAQAYADMKGINYIVIRHKASGSLGAIPKSSFDPAREEILAEVSGGGQIAAEARWNTIFERLGEMDSPGQ